MRSAGARATSERRSESWAMKRQAGPREPESRGAWGPGEKPCMSERKIGWVGWDFLPEVARRGRVKGRRRGAEEGLRKYGRPRGRRGASLGRGSSEVEWATSFEEQAAQTLWLF